MFEMKYPHLFTPLKIDEVYIDIRKRLIQALLQEGNIEEKLINEFNKRII